jgi:hypothetical protein
MDNILQPETWLSPAILGGVIAAMGYVGKLAIDLVTHAIDAHRKRRARLAELLALLRAGRASFRAQCKLRDDLSNLIGRSPAHEQEGEGDEDLFSSAYPTMTEKERELHALIRAFTVSAFRPLNQSLLDWLKADTYYRAMSPSHRRYGNLASFLAQLEAHLVMWFAKYEAWIPDHPEHALVFLADEHKHGIRFPENGTDLVAEALGHLEVTSRRRSSGTTASFGGRSPRRTKSTDGRQSVRAH